MKPAHLDLLRKAALLAVPAGALGSIGFTLWVGHRNDSRLLLMLFTVWVFSPFLALGWACVAAKRWAASGRAALHGVILVLALGSLVIYGESALGPPRAKPAFIFLVVPLVSWLLIAVVVPLVALAKNQRDPA